MTAPVDPEHIRFTELNALAGVLPCHRRYILSMMMYNQTKIVVSDPDDCHIRLPTQPNPRSPAGALTQAATGPAHGRP